MFKKNETKKPTDGAEVLGALRLAGAKADADPRKRRVMFATNFMIVCLRL